VEHRTRSDVAIAGLPLWKSELKVKPNSKGPRPMMAGAHRRPAPAVLGRCAPPRQTRWRLRPEPGRSAPRGDRRGEAYPATATGPKVDRAGAGGTTSRRCCVLRPYPSRKILPSAGLVTSRPFLWSQVGQSPQGLRHGNQGRVSLSAPIPPVYTCMQAVLPRDVPGPFFDGG